MKSRFALLFAAAFGAVHVQAATVQHASINDPANKFVTGGNGVASASTELGWYSSVTDSYSSPLGGGATFSLGGVTIRPRPGKDVLAGITLIGGGDLYLTVDLGANLLVPDLVGHHVTGSSISFIDAGSGFVAEQYYDFAVGLWDGSDLTYADSLSDLTFEIDAAADGSVSYLGGNLFRFNEAGPSGGSGSSLTVSSNLDGFFVRTFDIDAGGMNLGNVHTDSINIAAQRTLVPEPCGLALISLSGALASFRRRRA